MVQGGREVVLFLFVVLVAGFALGAVPAASAEGAPHVGITHPDAGATVSGIVTVTGEARDDVGIVKVLVGIDTGDRTLATDTSGNGTWWSWEWTWDTTKWANGWHHIVAVAYDDEGLAGDVGREVLVDNPDEAPHVEIRMPESGAIVNGTVTIAGHAWDDHEILVVKIRIDLEGPIYTAEDISGNGTWWVWRLLWNSRDVPNGEHVVYAKAIDNREQVGWDSIHVTVHNEGGNTPPWVTIVEPPQGSTVRGLVVIKGHAGDEDPDDRVELVQVKIDHGDWQNATDISEFGNWATWKFAWDTTHAEVGWHHLYARAFDGTEYSEVKVLELYVTREGGGNHAPEVVIDDPHHGDEVSGAVLVHGRAWDPDPDDRVTGVWVRIDSGEWHPAKDLTDNDTWFIWGWVWDTTRFENGWHAVCAKSYDGELYSEKACVEVKVQNPEDHAPGAEIEHPENGSVVSGVVLVHGFAWDDHGVEKVQVRIDEGEWHLAVDTSGNGTWYTWAWSWDTREYENGEHVVSARAWDGHQFSEVAKVVVTVENAHGGAFWEVLRDNPILVGVLGFGATVATSLVVWWRRYGLLGSLR